MIRTVLIPAAVCAAALALTGCGGGGGGGATPTVTVTTTETTTATATVTSPPVTVTPSPATASPSDPVSALDAWAICYAIAVPMLDATYWTPLGYDPDKNPPSGSPGAWTQVRVGFSSNSGGPGAAVDCTVDGTLGAPTVTTRGPIDFG